MFSAVTAAEHQHGHVRTSPEASLCPPASFLLHNRELSLAVSGSGQIYSCTSLFQMFAAAKNIMSKLVNDLDF